MATLKTDRIYTLLLSHSELKTLSQAVGIAFDEIQKGSILNEENEILLDALNDLYNTLSRETLND